jgi:hypothetical protein
LSGEKPGQWDLILAQVEFAYNDFVNRSVGKSPFHIVYGRSLKGVVDLVKFPNLEDKRSVDASEFAESMQEMHEQVKRKLQQSNTKYKEGADMRRRQKKLKKESW